MQNDLGYDCVCNSAEVPDHLQLPLDNVRNVKAYCLLLSARKGWPKNLDAKPIMHACRISRDIILFHSTLDKTNMDHNDVEAHFQELFGSGNTEVYRLLTRTDDHELHSQLALSYNRVHDLGGDWEKFKTAAPGILGQELAESEYRHVFAAYSYINGASRFYRSRASLNSKPNSRPRPRKRKKDPSLRERPVENLAHSGSRGEDEQVYEESGESDCPGELEPHCSDMDDYGALDGNPGGSELPDQAESVRCS